MHSKYSLKTKWLYSKSVLKKRGYNGYWDWAALARGMKRRMIIEYLKSRADLNFEIDIGVHGAITAIGTIMTKWDPIIFR